MNLSKQKWWGRFQKYYTESPEIDLAVDLRWMNVSDELFVRMEPRVQKAFADMDALEKGAIANLDKTPMAGFPMWDWIGGRTSELSAVGLLPAALQKLDIDDLLAVAAMFDKQTRNRNVKANSAMQLGQVWFVFGNDNGAQNMVVLPYKDRLVGLSMYLQQPVIESLGKESDLDGRVVNRGITVPSNKNSTGSTPMLTISRESKQEKGHRQGHRNSAEYFDLPCRHTKLIYTHKN